MHLLLHHSTEPTPHAVPVLTLSVKPAITTHLNVSLGVQFVAQYLHLLPDDLPEADIFEPILTCLPSLAVGSQRGLVPTW
jgi:hypothetical protein